MNSNIQQGVAISRALNELEKFFQEVEALRRLLSEQLNDFLSNSTEFKIGDIDYICTESESTWLFPWDNLSIAIFEKKTRKLIDDKAHRFINFQFSFFGESTAIPDQQARPILHVSSSGVRHCLDDFYVRYPIDRNWYFDDFPGVLSLEKNELIWSNYDYGDKFWHYSVDLLSINAANVKQILIDPVYRLLHGEPWEVVPDSALDKAIVRYENLESILK